MIKVLVFMESEIHKIEASVNEYAKTHEVHFVWNTGSRLVVILKEKDKPKSHHKKVVPTEEG